MRQISNERDYRNPASSITLGHSVRGGIERIGESDGQMNRIGDKTEKGDRHRQKDRGRCGKVGGYSGQRDGEKRRMIRQERICCDV